MSNVDDYLKISNSSSYLLDFLLRTFWKSTIHSSYFSLYLKICIRPMELQVFRTFIHMKPLSYFQKHMYCTHQLERLIVDVFGYRLLKKLPKENWILLLLLSDLQGIMLNVMNRWGFVCSTMWVLQQVSY